MKYAKFSITFFSFLLFYGCSRNAEREDEYKGIIINIYRDTNNHGTGTFTINTSSGEKGVTADLYSYSWKYASIGDSIIKRKGELCIIIKKKGENPRVFYYQ